MTATSDGTVITVWQVEQAILTLLAEPPAAAAAATTLAFYVAAVERQMGLPAQTIPLPPGPSSFRGGVDVDTMQAEWLPMVTVTVQPDGPPDYLDPVTVAQACRVDATCTAADDSEDTARMVAAAYAAAVARAVLDNGTLGGLSAQTRLVASPAVTLLNPGAGRQVARGTVGFSVLIAPMFTVARPVFGAGPYIASTPLPTVQTEQVTVTTTALPQ